MRGMRAIFLLTAVACIVVLGCSSSPKPSKSASSKKLSGTDEQIFLGDTIEKNYDPNVIMKRAESFFEKEDYPEAVIEYQHFLELHRVHVLAPYAQYKLGESYFRQIKTIDRDPDPIYKALEAFEKLRKDYPKSRWDADAAERIRACHDYIAQAYFFVGQFYYRREAYLAAAHRFEAILNTYPDLEVAGDALYYLALTYKELGADDWAREKLITFAERHPNNKHHAEGQKLLAKLNGKQPAPTIAMSQNSNHTTSPEDRTQTNGIPPQAAISALTPVTTLRTPAVTTASPQPTLCRLGVWC